MFLEITILECFKICIGHRKRFKINTISNPFLIATHWILVLSQGRILHLNPSNLPLSTLAQCRHAYKKNATNTCSVSAAFELWKTLFRQTKDQQFFPDSSLLQCSPLPPGPNQLFFLSLPVRRRRRPVSVCSLLQDRPSHQSLHYSAITPILCVLIPKSLSCWCRQCKTYNQTVSKWLRIHLEWNPWLVILK